MQLLVLCRALGGRARLLSSTPRVGQRARERRADVRVLQPLAVHLEQLAALLDLSDAAAMQLTRAPAPAHLAAIVKRVAAGAVRLVVVELAFIAPARSVPERADILGLAVLRPAWVRAGESRRPIVRELAAKLVVMVDAATRMRPPHTHLCVAVVPAAVAEDQLLEAQRPTAAARRRRRGFVRHPPSRSTRSPSPLHLAQIARRAPRAARRDSPPTPCDRTAPAARSQHQAAAVRKRARTHACAVWATLATPPQQPAPRRWLARRRRSRAFVLMAHRKLARG